MLLALTAGMIGAIAFGMVSTLFLKKRDIAWHSDFAITANIYTHLEFDLKLASAEAFKWIESTKTGQIGKNQNIESPEKSVVASDSEDLGKH